MAPTKSPGLARLFLEYAKPDAKGHTELITIDELNAAYGRTDFTTSNGGGWCRSDTKPLSDYVVERYRNPETGRIEAIQLKGFNPDRADRAIAPHVRKALKGRPCVVTGAKGAVEIDHKWGQINHYPAYRKLETQKPEDFQPLSRTVNLAKRSHCKECKEEKVRFDARRLGYSVPQWTGGTKFEKSCVGCYWHDPQRFNEIVSKDFSRKKS